MNKQSKDKAPSDDAGKAYEAALRLLDIRAHGSAELTKKLLRRFTDEAAQAAVERCARAGLIDDDAYALAYAQELSRNKLIAPSAIVVRLAMRGIDRETAQAALAEADIDAADTARRLALRLMPADPDKDDRSRVLRALQRAGYGYAAAGRAIDAALSAQNNSED